MTTRTHYPTPPHERLILEIARDIQAAWPNVYYGAKPYLESMLTLTTMSSKHGLDDAKTIVVYFLANATTFRGEAARALKAELKALAGIK
jgi:hypothetical protein